MCVCGQARGHNFDCHRIWHRETEGPRTKICYLKYITRNATKRMKICFQQFKKSIYQNLYKEQRLL